MTIIEQIKSEIERLKNNSELAKMEWVKEGYNQNAFAEDCRISSFDKLLSFLSTLESEKPMNQEWLEADLEKEIKDTCRGYRINDYHEQELGKHDIENIARHFAEWGAEHTPLPEDTVLFNKGVAEGKRLMMEDAIVDRRQIAFMIEDARRCGVIEGRKQVLDDPGKYGLQELED